VITPLGKNGHKPLFSINLEDDGILEEPGKDGKSKNILSFKVRGLKT
jgi:hypothetical protein